MCFHGVVLFLLCSKILLGEEKNPVFSWIKDGVTVTSLIVQDVVARSPERAIFVNYTEIGVTVDDKSLTQRFVTQNQNWRNEWGSRLYLLNNDRTNYETFDLRNKELSFDVDVSSLVCGLNGALYMIEMPKNGGAEGSAFGTGYCDAGGGGTDSEKLACTEIDLWEGNKEATHLASHSCSRTGQFSVGEGKYCAIGGCTMNPYRYDHSFYGYGSSYTVDTSKKFTVVTQFLTSASGNLNEIRRLYVQKGKVVSAPAISNGAMSYSSITDAFCEAAGVSNSPLQNVSNSLEMGHVLSFSLWASDDGAGMDWLNSGKNGRCPENSEAAKRTKLVKSNPGAHVTWSNLKVGAINSTFTRDGGDGSGSLLVRSSLSTLVCIFILLLTLFV